MEHQWRGPFKSAFAALAAAADEHGLTMQVQGFVWRALTTWDDPLEDDDFLDDLLAEIAGDTWLVVQKRDDGWYGVMDN